MPILTVAGTPRVYETRGTGPHVIAVHGSLSNARQWRTLGDRLADRFTVVAPDLALAAQDDDGPRFGAFSFADDVALVTALIAAAPAPVHLVGHSYGGVVAIQAALARPEGLRSLVLIEPSCFHLLAQAAAPEYEEIAQLLTRQQDAVEQGDPSGSARLFIDYWMGPDAWPAMPERRRGIIAAGVPKLAEDWRGVLASPTGLEDYRGLTMPVLLLRARDTRRLSARLVDMIAAVLPAATLSEVAQGGHMAPVTNPDPVNAVIDRFVVACGG